MKTPPLPADEVLRLTVLQHYGLLDTPPEEAFDDLTALAAQICDVPISLISLVDRERQWFKSKIGLEISGTPRDVSFCGHAILQPDLFVVPDALQDERFADNPLVTGDSGIRFYAGMPLISSSGHPLGTLCIMDRKPRELTPAQQESLKRLTRQVVSQFELRRRSIELAESEERLSTVTENARVGLVIVSHDHRYLYANQAYAELVDKPLPEIVGNRVADVLSEFYHDQIRPRLDTAFTGKRVSYEVTLSPKKFLAVTYEPRITDDVVTQVVAVITEISARKEAESALQVREQQLQLFAEHSPAAIAMFDRDMRYLVVSNRWMKAFGPPDQKLIGKCHYDIFPNLPQRWLDIHQRCLAGAVEKCDEDPFQRAEGQIDWIRWEVRPWHQADHTIGGIIIFSEDISERKQAENVLKETTRFAHSTIDALSAHICVLDESGTVLATNEAWRQFAAENPNAALEAGTVRNYLLVCDDAVGSKTEEAEAFAAGIQSVISGKQKEFSMEYPCHSKNEHRWFVGHVTRFPSGGPVRIVVAHENITERKLAEMDASRMAAIVESSHDAIVGKDVNGFVNSWNHGAELLFGYRSEEMIGTSILRLIPASRKDEETYILNQIRNGLTVEHFETERLKKDGTLIHVSVTVSPIRNSRGEIIGASKVARDISKRKEAEAALRNSEERFRELAENINEVFWITDPTKNQMLYISPAYEKIWSRSCQSLYDSPHTWLESIHPDDRAKVLLASQTKQVDGLYNETYRVVRPDGSIRWIHDQAFPIKASDGLVKRIVGVAEDVTNQRNLEEQFRQAQKMEAIGQLAGGVAHDFNNILAAILMQSELAAITDGVSAELQEGLGEIRSLAERAAKLTRQLLLFSRKQVMHTRELDLNDAVTSLVKMLQRIIGEHISLQINLSPSPLLIRADPGMFDQVLMNLVVNARDAMPEGGRILLETKYMNLGIEAASAIGDITPGPFACLRVSDAGVGISPEIISRIFDPFFTTKEPGKGTGLGLATVFGIIKQHGGAITVESKVDHGTTFLVYLPIHAVSEPSKPEHITKPRPRGGTETILLVEDDTSVRLLTRIVLERAGYTVLDASDGKAAMELGSKHRNKIRLILTDIVMPGGMNGRELAARLQKEDPRLQVILTSGYSSEIAGRDIDLQPRQKFLQKPAPPHELLTVIRDSLDS